MSHTYLEPFGLGEHNSFYTWDHFFEDKIKSFNPSLQVFFSLFFFDVVWFGLVWFGLVGFVVGSTISIYHYFTFL